MNNTPTTSTAYADALVEYGDAINRYNAALSRKDPNAFLCKKAMSSAAHYLVALADALEVK